MRHCNLSTRQHSPTCCQAVAQQHDTTVSAHTAHTHHEALQPHTAYRSCPGNMGGARLVATWFNTVTDTRDEHPPAAGRWCRVTPGGRQPQQTMASITTCWWVTRQTCLLKPTLAKLNQEQQDGHSCTHHSHTHDPSWAHITRMVSTTNDDSSTAGGAAAAQWGHQTPSSLRLGLDLSQWPRMAGGPWPRNLHALTGRRWLRPSWEPGCCTAMGQSQKCPGGEHPRPSSPAISH